MTDRPTTWFYQMQGNRETSQIHNKIQPWLSLIIVQNVHSVVAVAFSPIRQDSIVDPAKAYLFSILFRTPCIAAAYFAGNPPLSV
jgi:hypothetical protein